MDDKFQKEKRDKVAEKHYNDAQEIIDHIEMLYPGYHELCVQLLQFEGQEKFPPRIRQPRRESAWEEFPSLYSEKELEERAKYHDPNDEMLLKGPMSEIRGLLQTYDKLKAYYRPT